MPEPVVLQPDLYIGGMRVAEPVTSLTALMISAVCTYAWVRLKRTTPPHPVQTLVRGFFLLMALATLSGGILGHALLYKFSLAWKLPGWVLSMVAIAALERAANQNPSNWTASVAHIRHRYSPETNRQDSVLVSRSAIDLKKLLSR